MVILGVNQVNFELNWMGKEIFRIRMNKIWYGFELDEEVRGYDNVILF